MTVSRREKTGEFQARGSDGKTYTVVVITEFLDSTLIHGDVKSEVPGPETYWILPATKVLQIGGEFFIPATGVTLVPL